jgi:hypothetical protein
MTLKRTFWLVGAALAAWGVFHMTRYEYRYEVLGTGNQAMARSAIVGIERATGTACVWARRGWICVDPATYGRAKQEGWSAPPPLRDESMPRPNVGTRW